ncbi:hypothetical protein ACQ4PT_056034 [Festuca glaucescens]
MDKKKEIAEGKKRVEEQHSSAEENITPLARRAAARSVAIRTGELSISERGAPAPEKKLMASAFTAEAGKKKGMMAVREGNAAEDEDILVVDFTEARKELKTPWIIMGYYNTKRVFNTGGLFIRLRQIWQLHGGMEEKGMGEKHLLIVLEKEGDYNHILKGGPWLYQNDAFLIAKYDVGKDNRGHVWASFLHDRVEHDVEKPIKRWITLAGKEEGKPRRFEVKYEGAPHFCFFCGIFGHTERTCLLLEEEKIIRYCEEQRASPFRRFEHRSYYVPADDKKIKRSLHFSPASSGWKLTPESVSVGEEDPNNLVILAQDVGAVEDEEQQVPEPIQDVLAAAVTNLTVHDGSAMPAVTDDQVTKACEAVNKSSRWKRQNRAGKKMKGSPMQRAGGLLARAALGTAGGMRITPVPPILECLREDGSLYAELRGDAAQTASAFLKKKKGCSASARWQKTQALKKGVKVLYCVSAEIKVQESVKQVENVRSLPDSTPKKDKPAKDGVAN